MINGLAWVELLAPELDLAVSSYRIVLGREPSGMVERDGVARVLFALDRTALMVAVPIGPGAAADLLRARLATQGSGLSGLGFAVERLADSARRLRRLSIEADAPFELAFDAGGGAARQWTAQALPPSVAHGPAIWLAEAPPLAGSVPASAQPADRPLAAGAGFGTSPDDAVHDVDLALLSTGSPERAMALYGARLGLSLVFDRLLGPQSRLLQFACGDSVIEVGHRLDAAQQPPADAITGIGWTVGSLRAANQRLRAAGLEVSDPKVGAKPRTEVFTLRSGTLGVRTLFVERLAG